MAGSRCSREEELLRQVLLSPGFEEDELGNMRDVKGVEWRLGRQVCLFGLVCQAL